MNKQGYHSSMNALFKFDVKLVKITIYYYTHKIIILVNTNTVNKNYDNYIYII